jgi:hypothetical protein
MERPYIDIVIPMRQLAKEHGTVKDATVMFYIFDDKGTTVDYREKSLAIPARPATDKVIRQKVVLPPGNYVAKSLLRVEKSLGFAKVAFTVPNEK